MEFKPKDKTSNVQYIFHVYAGIENGKLKLFNPLEINTKLNFNSTTIGYIKYHYPKFHNFNYELAKKQNVYLTDLSKNFKVNIDQFGNRVPYDFYDNLEIVVIKEFEALKFKGRFILGRISRFEFELDIYVYIYFRFYVYIYIRI